jgi:hypothetical protein
MKKFDPEKLSVEYRDAVSFECPLIGRRYTLTHSDATAQLFLTVGKTFAWDKTTNMRDEVLAEWRIHLCSPYLYVYVPVDGETGPELAKTRYAIFRRELPLALAAMVYGDRNIYQAFPSLSSAPIWVHFDSKNMEFNQFEYWGVPQNYW